MWVQSLGREDPLEKGMATRSSIRAWRIPMDRGAWRVTVHRIAKSQTRLRQLSTRACTERKQFKLFLRNKNTSLKSRKMVLFTHQ